jgi:anti-sigma factor RsiW
MDVRPYVTCHELIDFLYLYLEDELPPARKSEFERHLAVCPSCRNYIETYREAIIVEKRAFLDSAEALCKEAPEELVAAILELRRKTR